MAGGEEQGPQMQKALASHPAQPSLPVQPRGTHLTALSLRFLSCCVTQMPAFFPRFLYIPQRVLLFVVLVLRFLLFGTFISSPMSIPFSLFHPRVGIELSPILLISLRKITCLVSLYKADLTEGSGRESGFMSQKYR